MNNVKLYYIFFFWLHFKWQGCQAWKYVMVHNRGKYYSLWLKDQIRRVQYTMAYNTYERSHFSFWITAPSSISSWDHKKMICWISLAHCVSLRLWAFIEMCSIIIMVNKMVGNCPLYCHIPIHSETMGWI